MEYARGEHFAKRFEIVDRLDKSPLGVTYRVKNLGNGSYQRLLLLDPVSFQETPEEDLEAAWKLSQSLDHPAHFKPAERGETDGVTWLAMEDFEGQTLREILAEHRMQGQPMGLREASQLAIQMLEACRPLHDQGTSLRALRPEYVHVSLRRTGPGGRNVVARVKLAATPYWSLIPPGALAADEYAHGEAQYLAPELKRFNPLGSIRNDIFSIGVIYYEMLVGAPPVGTYQLPRSRRPDLPKHVDTVVELALAQTPEDRYPSAQDFVADIQRAFQVPDSEPDEKQRLHPAVLLLSIVLVAAVGFLALGTRTDPDEQARQAAREMRRAILDANPLPSSEEVRQAMEGQPPNMLYIPPGPYVTGRMRHEHIGDEPFARVEELPGYLIDAFEYPNLRGATPKTNVSHAEAERLCADAGKRLCSSEEFEKACRGPKNLIYGYGDTWDPDFCGKDVDDPHASGARGDCKSGWGVYDIAGNFPEWTSTARGNNRRIIKGGHLGIPERATRCTYSRDVNVSYADPAFSFRCCRDLDAPPYKPSTGSDDEAQAE